MEFGLAKASTKDYLEKEYKRNFFCRLLVRRERSYLFSQSQTKSLVISLKSLAIIWNLVKYFSKCEIFCRPLSWMVLISSVFFKLFTTCNGRVGRENQQFFPRPWAQVNGYEKDNNSPPQLWGHLTSPQCVADMQSLCVISVAATVCNLPRIDPPQQKVYSFVCGVLDCHQYNCQKELRCHVCQVVCCQ